MPQLRIDLQEGFTGDLVIMRFDGKEIYRASPRTKLQIGLAEVCTIDVPDSTRRLSLDVEIPTRGASASYGFVPSGDLSVGVSLEPNGVISFRTSLEAFGYV